MVETYSMEALAKKIVGWEREASAGDIYLHVVYKLLPELEKQVRSLLALLVQKYKYWRCSRALSLADDGEGGVYGP